MKNNINDYTYSQLRMMSKEKFVKMFLLDSSVDKEMDFDFYINNSYYNWHIEELIERAYMLHNKKVKEV